MSSRSLNKVQLIGNLTRDPELRYTPTGAAVCTIGLATNRTWTTDAGEKREDVEYHRLVAWNKFAELCSQLLAKGRKIYVEGRLQTRTWQGTDGRERSTTEIVIDDMIILDPRRVMSSSEETSEGGQQAAPSQQYAQPVKQTRSQPKKASSTTVDDIVSSADGATEQSGSQIEQPQENINPDDIPF